MNYEGNDFGINLDERVIWKNRTMGEVLIWLLNKHGVSYRALGELLGINGQMARKKGLEGAKYITRLREIDIRLGRG